MKTQKKNKSKEEDKGIDSKKFNAGLKHLLKTPHIKKTDLKKTKPRD